MFTGIVQGIGTVRSIEKDDAVWTYTVQLPNTTGLKRGASVAINGVCLTATDMDDECLSLIHISEPTRR